MKTPTTRVGLVQYDRVSPMYAALIAWSNEGRYGMWHNVARLHVRWRVSRKLAAALDSINFSRATEVYAALPVKRQDRLHDIMPLLGRALDREV